MKSVLLQMALSSAVILGCLATALAMPIVEGPGAFTYTFHAGSDVPDPNATTVGTSFNIETPANGNAAYYYTSSSNSSGDVEYTFQAAPGSVFVGSITTQEVSLVAFNPGGEVTETVTGTATPTVVLSSSDSGFYTDDTAHSFDVNGLTTFTIDYHLDNPSGNAIFTQVFRETNGSTDTPFSVSGVVSSPTPEPASLVLLGLGAAALLAAVRRRRRA